MISKVLLVAGLLGATSLVAQGQISGWYTETRVTSRHEGERAAVAPSPRNETIRSWRTSNAERVEGGLPPWPQYDMTGAYMISRRSEKRSYQVVPSSRTIRVLDMASMNALKLAMPSYDAPAARDVGDGGVILGHRTRKYQMTMRMRMPGVSAKGDTTVFTSEQTLWVATDRSDSLVAAYLADRPKPTGPSRLPVLPGMVLRSESRSHTVASYITLGIREVVAWRREVIDPSRFALPADYKRVNMADELRVGRAESRAPRVAAESLHVANQEMRRLFSRADPKDRARARQLAESLLTVMKKQQASHPYDVRNDPKAVRITDTIPARKKP